MKLQQFNGGLSTLISPNLIQVNEGVEYENIDNSSAILKPIKGKTLASIPVEKYSYYYLGAAEWVASSSYRDYLEYQEILYYTETGSYPKKYDGTNEYRLGIIAPTSAPLIDSIENQPLPITAASIVQTSIGDIHAQEDNGTQKTLGYLFVNIGANGLASTTFVGEIELVGTDTHVSLDISVTGMVNETKVYRSYLGVSRYVGTLTSSVPSLTDAAYDIESYDAYEEIGLSGTYQYVFTNYNSADGTESVPSELTTDAVVAGGICKLSNIFTSTDPQVDGRRLYRIGGNLTDFTLVTTLNNITTSYDDGTKDSELEGEILDSTYNNEALDGLQYLVEAYGVLFGALDDKLYYSRVGLPNAWPSTNYIDFEAPIIGLGIVANGIIVFTKFKSMLLTGTNTGTFLPYPLGGDQGCISHQSIQRIKGAILWASTDGICTTSGAEVTVMSKVKLGKLDLDVENAVVYDNTYFLHQTNGKTLAFDVELGGIYKQQDYSVDRLVKANDILYGYLAGELYSIESNTTVEAMTYLSPLLTDGSYCNRKTYKNFYMRSEGDITVVIYIDDVEMSSTTVSTTDTHDLTVPQEDQAGYAVQFRISGTGIVYELEYRVMERQNGR